MLALKRMVSRMGLHSTGDVQGSALESRQEMAQVLFRAVFHLKRTGLRCSAHRPTAAHGYNLHESVHVLGCMLPFILIGVCRLKGLEIKLP